MNEKFFTAAKRVCQEHRREVVYQDGTRVSFVPRVLLDELADAVDEAAVDVTLGAVLGVPRLTSASKLFLSPGPLCSAGHCCDYLGMGVRSAVGAPLPPFHTGCDCALYLR